MEGLCILHCHGLNLHVCHYCGQMWHYTLTARK
jgi:hypothetical protein